MRENLLSQFHQPEAFGYVPAQIKLCQVFRAGIRLEQLLFLLKQEHPGTVPSRCFVLQSAFLQESPGFRDAIQHRQFMQPMDRLRGNG